MGKKNDWELPRAAHVPARDPWSGPGHARQLSNDSHHVNPNSPFACTGCGASLSIPRSYAFNGELYCGSCRPPGAISASRDLPLEHDFGRDVPEFGGNGFRFSRHRRTGIDEVARWLFGVVFDLVVRLYRSLR